MHFEKCSMLVHCLSLNNFSFLRAAFAWPGGQVRNLFWGRQRDMAHQQHHPQGLQSTMHRYKLRSTSASAPSPQEDDPIENKTGGSDSDMECGTARPSTSSPTDDPPSKKPKLRRKTKLSLSKKSPFVPVAVIEPVSMTGITSLPQEIVWEHRCGIGKSNVGI